MGHIKLIQMNDTYLGQCGELDILYPDLTDVGCCGNCHEDNEEYGYTLFYIDTDKGFYEVCCRINAAYKNGIETGKFTYD